MALSLQSLIMSWKVCFIVNRFKTPVFYYWPFQGCTSVVVPYCYLFLLSVFIPWFTYYVSDIFWLSLGSWMTVCLGKSCSFGLPRVTFVNCGQFMYLVISLLVLRAGCGIWLYQFLIIVDLLTVYDSSVLHLSRVDCLPSSHVASFRGFTFFLVQIVLEEDCDLALSGYIFSFSFSKSDCLGNAHLSTLSEINLPG